MSLNTGMSRLRENPATKLWISLAIMFIVMGFGTIGYHFIEGWTVLDSLYMTLITLTTVGYGETHPLSQRGVIFTVILITCGMSLLFYTAQTATRLIVEGEVRKHLGRRRMKKSLAGMKNHFILCGYGRIGRKICREFSKEKLDYLVIERDPDTVLYMTERGVRVIHGEATRDEVLLAAGIKRAKVLITAVNSPADNVYITLTARGLNPDIFIVARTESTDNGRKLYRAGANRVIFPHSIGGRRMAMAALRPAVDQFLDMEFLQEKYGVYLDEIRLKQESNLCCKSLKDAAISKNFGLNVIGIISSNSDVEFNPGPDTVLQSGDDLILFGSRDQLDLLRKEASGR